ncbi:MAG: YceI family protein [Myxococcales bacterium]|nr:YceI family protein [Myxococcales bacterium]
MGASRFAIVGSGRASFLIDAPLEKIKGRWTRFDGELKVDAADLRETGGRVSMDLGDLRTHTFGDSGKDAKQTEHAKNWMEIGREVSSAVRAKYAQAVFSIERIERVEPERLDASMKAVATVAGTLTLHGIEAAKRVEVELRFEGSPDAPTGVEISTKKPLSVSLSRHQIKPRDLTGRFLAGALERVGQKIADRAQVSVSIQARRR